MSTIDFRMPDVGEGIAEAEVVTWHVQTGERVRRDEPFVTIETDKARLDIPAPCDGILAYRGASTGEIVQVGTLLARFEEPSGHDPPPIEQDAPPVTRSRPLASPSTRRLASSLGSDLFAITGTGPGGRITRDDVERSSRGSSAPGPSGGGPPPTVLRHAEDVVIPLRGIRRATARAMAAAATIPTIYEWREIDATAIRGAVSRLRTHMGDGGPHISILTFVASAVTSAVATHPRMNATFDPTQEQTVLHARCDLGIATATGDGLVVPVIRDVGARSLRALATDIADVADRARRRELSPSETTAGTITITNFGSFGTQFGTPLLRVPEVAIVGVGHVEDRVVASAGRPVVRPILPLSVATDHRVNDGEHLAAFCATLEELLLDPILLLGRA